MKSNEAKLDQVVAGCGGSGSGLRALDRTLSAQMGERGGIRTARGRKAALKRGEALFGKKGTSQGNIKARTKRGRK